MPDDLPPQPQPCFPVSSVGGGTRPSPSDVDGELSVPTFPFFTPSLLP
ncbi:MAG TPA: hypothetical protein PLJ10_12845 [Candidatus Hydrogenedens sp.]|nr:hypothetical protein [Candidatus Hydrogenedens sp.]